MLTLNFKISRYYIAFLCLNRHHLLKDSFKKGILKLIKENINNPYLYLIYLEKEGYPLWAMRYIFGEEKIRNVSQELDKIFLKVFKLKDFKPSLYEAQAFKNKVKRQWEKNKIFVEKYLKEVLKLSLPLNNFDVIIVPPFLNTGHSSWPNLIFWGHKEEFKNYSTIYLVHELLHIIFHNYKIPTNKLSHSLIELIADNELRIRLNKKGKYFKENNIPTCHLELKKLETKMLSYWRDYLNGKSESKDIVSFYKFLEKNLNFS